MSGVTLTTRPDEHNHNQRDQQPERQQMWFEAAGGQLGKLQRQQR
jgi:hypothetical protein